MPPQEPNQPDPGTPAANPSGTFSGSNPPAAMPQPASSPSVGQDVSAPATMQALGGTVISPTAPAPGPVAPAQPTPQVIASTAHTASPFGGTPAAQPAQPVAPAAPAPSGIPQPMVTTGSDGSGPLSSPVTAGTASSPGKKKRLRLITAVVALVVVLGGGYVFAIYIPNSPSHVYSASLDRSARAYDKLVEYSKDVQTKKYKSLKTDGSFKFVSSEVSGDGTFNSESDDKNGTATINVNIAGIKAGLNARAVTASGQDTADLYFQVNGVKSVLNSYGLTQFASLDGQWISVDHTLLESAAASAAGDSEQSDLKAPTSAQVQDALAKVGEVNRQYIFKADADHAVLKKEKYLGKSTVNGRQVYGYQVGYDKAHLKAYVKALQSGINDSSLNAWIKSASGKSASQADLSELTKSIDKAKSDYTFTMYVDAKTKLINVLHFKDTSSNDYFEIGQAYTGGSVYPFSFKVVSKDDPKNAGTFEMTARIDSATNKLSFNANLDVKDNGSPITFKLTANATMGNDTVTVTAPAGAKSVMEVYQSLGLDSYLGGTSTTDSLDGFSSDDFLLTQ